MRRSKGENTAPSSSGLSHSDSGISANFPPAFLRHTFWLSGELDKMKSAKSASCAFLSLMRVSVFPLRSVPKISPSYSVSSPLRGECVSVKRIA